ncbi:hypothetical protein [Actinokineospora sp. HUAS TT18]|uniref:hypothetical protein n=1 Tax=Actinokineospora sp. HUAS TT18 TaxID=3447451 RepID=UPI003F5203C0
MSTARKMGAYGVILAVVAAGAYALGSAVGPFDAPAPETGTHQGDPGHVESK